MQFTDLRKQLVSKSFALPTSLAWLDTQAPLTTTAIRQWIASLVKFQFPVAAVAMLILLGSVLLGLLAECCSAGIWVGVTLFLAALGWPFDLWDVARTAQIERGRVKVEFKRRMRNVELLAFALLAFACLLCLLAIAIVRLAMN